MTAAGQEVVGFPHQLGIAGEIDLAGAGAEQRRDLVEQAGAGAAFEKSVGAGADQERALQRRDGAADGAGRCERSEIASRPRLRAAMFEDLRRPMVAGDQDIGKRFVVTQMHVEARPQLLDQIGFEQQRLGLGRGRDDLDGRRSPQSCAGCAPAAARLTRHRTTAACGRFRVPDIEHVPVGQIEHAVDAGRSRRQPHRVLDRGMANRKRSLADRLRGLVGRLRRALLVLFGGRNGGVDIVDGSAGSCGGISGRWPRRAFCGGGRFRLVGRIVIDGPKLSAGLPHRQRWGAGEGNVR